LVADKISEAVRHPWHMPQARSRALSILDRGFHMGGPTRVFARRATCLDIEHSWTPTSLVYATTSMPGQSTTSPGAGCQVMEGRARHRKRTGVTGALVNVVRRFESRSIRATARELVRAYGAWLSAPRRFSTSCVRPRSRRRTLSLLGLADHRLGYGGRCDRLAHRGSEPRAGHRGRAHRETLSRRLSGASDASAVAEPDRCRLACRRRRGRAPR